MFVALFVVTHKSPENWPDHYWIPFVFLIGLFVIDLVIHFYYAVAAKPKQQKDLFSQRYKQISFSSLTLTIDIVLLIIVTVKSGFASNNGYMIVFLILCGLYLALVLFGIFKVHQFCRGFAKKTQNTAGETQNTAGERNVFINRIDL